MTHAMTTMPKYESYKDSGFEWLKEVPSHWELLRLGSRFEERRTKVSDKDFAPLSVTKMGIVPQLDSAAKTNDGDNRKLVKKGDFVINSRSDRKGSSGIAFQDGSVSLINTVLHPKEIHPTYCNYLLKSNGFVEEFYRMGHGIVADLWTTRYDEMSSIILGIPTLEEQEAIAKFLDEKTVQIDEAIGIKERQIALLKERKQIIIQNAVTKGLNPNAPMKDSGVDWIGDIPSHWEVRKLKHLSKINRSALSENTAKDFQFDYVDISNVTFENGIENADTYTFSNAPSRARRIAKAGDTIVSTVRTYLKAIDYINDEKCHYIFSTGFAVVEPRNFVHPEYLTRFISSNAFTNQVDTEAKGVSYPAINSTELGNLSIALPPMNEMREITGYINLHMAQMNTAIEKQKQQIINLREYKASLINSAVTGKIKVI